MYYLEDAEFLRTTIADLVIGIIFALGGAYGALRKASKENKDAALTTKVLEWFINKNGHSVRGVTVFVGFILCEIYFYR